MIEHVYDHSSKPSERTYILIYFFSLCLQGFFASMPYGDGWRNHRRLFQQYFATKHLPRDQEKQLDFVRKILLPNIFAIPEESSDHVTK
jgi:hypothetical protein